VHSKSVVVALATRRQASAPKSRVCPHNHAPHHQKTKNEAQRTKHNERSTTNEAQRTKHKEPGSVSGRPCGTIVLFDLAILRATLAFHTAPPPAARSLSLDAIARTRESKDALRH